MGRFLVGGEAADDDNDDEDEERDSAALQSGCRKRVMVRTPMHDGETVDFTAGELLVSAAPSDLELDPPTAFGVSMSCF